MHLIGNGEASLRRWWGFTDRLDRPVQAAEGFPDRTQPAALTLHGVASWAEGDNTIKSVKFTWFTKDGKAARAGVNFRLRPFLKRSILQSGRDM